MNEIDELRYLIQSVQKEGSKQFGDYLLAKLDITHSQSEVLVVLNQYEPISLAELGSLLFCENGSPSRLVKRLVDKKLVFQSQSLEDSRKSVLHLTKAGRDLVPKIKEIETQFNQSIEKKLGDKISVKELNAILHEQIKGTDSERKMKLRKNS